MASQAVTLAVHAKLQVGNPTTALVDIAEPHLHSDRQRIDDCVLPCMLRVHQATAYETSRCLS